jgi:hypothetical protein
MSTVGVVREEEEEEEEEEEVGVPFGKLSRKGAGLRSHRWRMLLACVSLY